MVKALRCAAAAAVWLLLWQLLHSVVGLSVLVPSPLEVLRELLRLGLEPAFWLSVLSSLGRVLAGFLLGCAAGTLLALLTSFSRWALDFFSPMLHVIKATPVASFIILALVWLRVRAIPVFTAFLIVLPTAWSNVSAGIAAADPQLLEMARAFRFSRKSILLQIYLPTLRPYLTAAASIGMGMAWKAGIAAEVLCTPRYSIGSALYSSKIYLDTPGLFAWTAAVILLSVLLEHLLLALSKAGKEARR